MANKAEQKDGFGKAMAEEEPDTLQNPMLTVVWSTRC